MNKIRKYLIHLLGGVIRYSIRSTGLGSIQAVLSFMKHRYGMPADEWCKAVYGYVYEVHDRAEKELATFLKTNDVLRR